MSICKKLYWINIITFWIDVFVYLGVVMETLMLESLVGFFLPSAPKGIVITCPIHPLARPSIWYARIIPFISNNCRIYSIQSKFKCEMLFIWLHFHISFSWRTGVASHGKIPFGNVATLYNSIRRSCCSHNMPFTLQHKANQNQQHNSQIVTTANRKLNTGLTVFGIIQGETMPRICSWAF